MSEIKVQSKNRFGSTQIDMITRIVKFCLDPANVAITNSIAAFGVLITMLQGYLDTINTLLQSISTRITGYAAQKNMLKNSVATMSATIMKAVYSFAASTDNEVLMAQMNTTMSDIKRMKDDQVGPFVQAAIDRVSGIIGSLVDYNVNATIVGAWQTLLTAYVNVLADPGNAIAARKSINEEIQFVLRATMLLIYRRADSLALSFKTDNLAYYRNYRSNRKLKPHHLSTQLRMWVTDQNNNPVTEGEVFIIGTSRSEFLDKRGYCLVNYIPFGNHSVTLTTADGSHTYGEFDFKKGKSRTLRVVIDTMDSSAPSTAKSEETPVATSTPAFD